MLIVLSEPLLNHHPLNHLPSVQRVVGFRQVIVGLA
jgi:hypothetical protein